MYRLMWRRDGSEGIKWWLWRLTEDGAYFGTVHLITSEPHRGSILTVEGMVPQPEWRRGREILRELSSPDVLPPGPCFALLAEAGPADQDRIFFKYDLGDEKRSRRAALFLELREILEREISKEYVGFEFSHHPFQISGYVDFSDPRGGRLRHEDSACRWSASDEASSGRDGSADTSPATPTPPPPARTPRTPPR
jgi:hypothetical protein